MSLKPFTRAPRAGLVAALAVSGLLAACTAAPAPPTSPPPAAPTTPSPPASSPTPLPTLVVPTASVGPSPAPVAEALATLREDAVYLADGWGAQARQVLSLGPASSVALHGTQLAYVVNNAVLLADLRGGAPRRLADAPPAFLLGPDLAWTADGQALLTIADREDPQAQRTGRRIDVGVITLADGVWRPGLALADRAGVTILQAPRAGGQVLLVAWADEPSFREALRYELATGQLLATLPIAGQGDITPSADGQQALTCLFDPAGGANSILVYDLVANTAPVHRRLELPSQTHAVSLAWSPDGRRVAYLLRQGRTPWDGPGHGLGIWIWDLEQERTAKVIEATDPAAGPVAWTPDGRYLIFRQVDAAGVGAFHALAVEGGTVNPLSLDPASRILGWIPG